MQVYFRINASRYGIIENYKWILKLKRTEQYYIFIEKYLYVLRRKRTDYTHYEEEEYFSVHLHRWN